MSDKTPEYIGPGHVRLEPGSFKLHIGRGWDSDFAAGRQATVSVAYIAVSPHGWFTRWPRSPLKRWWMRRRGWVFYDGDGKRA